jgi:tRNA dimethylallyltransferase
VASRLIAVVGPTAAGKSELALSVAAARNGEIVSCDSLQVYRGFDLGSAKPTPEERRAVPHHLLDVVDPDQGFSAAEYARRAREAARTIAARGGLPLVVGGTGLYLRAFLSGLFEGPSRDEPLRRRLEALAERGGNARLHRLLERVDPEAAARIPAQDRVRVIRALEVFRDTGRPLSAHHRDGAVPLAGFDVLVIGLDPGPEELRRRVEARTQRMIAGGLLDEVRGLLAAFGPDLRPLRAIGYREAMAVLDGRLAPAELARGIVTATMRYAKRQRTWFRHQAQAQWFRDPETALAAALAWLDGDTA